MAGEGVPKPGRFGDLKALRQSRQAPEHEDLPGVEGVVLEPEVLQASQEPPLPPLRGRKPSPLSKSRNPEYRQRSLWLRDAVYFAAEVQLIEQFGKSKDMSELVGELLEAWCVQQKALLSEKSI